MGIKLQCPKCKAELNLIFSLKERKAGAKKKEKTTKKAR